MITATVTHLRMQAPFPLVRWNRSSSDLPQDFCLARARQPELELYRQLYDAVGSPWSWVTRKNLNDKELGAIIHATDTEIYILWQDGRAVGFTELTLKNFPTAELVFIGVIPELIGLGLGSHMLRHALSIAAERSAQAIQIQTCTLDHPSALPLYQRYGFTPVSRQRVILKNGRFSVIA